MSKTAHTPGPWSYRPQKYDDWGYVRGPKQADGLQPFICQARDMRAMDDDVLNKHRRNGTDPWEANARLIAAAPDLLEALEEIEGMGHSEPMTWAGSELDWAKRRAGIMQTIARAAIAKAKGSDT